MEAQENTKIRDQYSLSNWWKTALGWGIFMWLFTEVIHLFYKLPSVFGEAFSWQTLLWWMLGGFLYAGSMHLYFKWKSRASSPHNS
jgi:polyferredoxin